MHEGVNISNLVIGPVPQPCPAEFQIEGKKFLDKILSKFGWVCSRKGGKKSAALCCCLIVEP
jgi:hypothetical protein